MYMYLCVYLQYKNTIFQIIYVHLRPIKRWNIVWTQTEIEKGCATTAEGLGCIEAVVRVTYAIMRANCANRHKDRQLDRHSVNN